MKKFNKLLTLTLGIILIFSILSYSEEEKNYFDKVQQDFDYTLGKRVGEIISKVKKGEKSGREALSNFTLRPDEIRDNISGLSKLVLVSPPNEDVKSLKDAPEDGIVYLKEGHTWTEMHQKVIQTITYYVVAQLMTKRALTDLDLQQLKSAEKFIELGDEAKEQYMSMARFEELDEDN